MLGRRDFFLLALFLLAQSHLRPASAAPRDRDGGEEAPRETQLGPRGEAGAGASREVGEAAGDELFPDVEPEELAAVLLRAIQSGGEAQPEQDEVRGQTRSAEAQPEEREESEEKDRRPAEAGRLKDLLRELRRFGAEGEAEEAEEGAAARRGPRESPPPRQALRGDRREEEALRPKATAKRRAPPMPAGPGPSAAGEEPWSGARKLRQQQHLEHQLLQRRYEELAESRRQAEEARRAAAEEERLADLASDLLLQYLLKDGEEEEEDGGEEDGGPDRGDGGAAGRRGGPLLFEDEEEEANVAEDKRSDEAEEDEEIDPNTIDRLIELSSQLHLPADDVVDLINEVEEKKRKKDFEPPRAKARVPPLAPPPPPKPKKAPQPPPPPRYAAPGPSSPFRPQPPPPLRKPPQPRRPKPDESAWNEILKPEDEEDEYPAPQWPRKLSNAISPWTFRPRPRPRPLPRRPQEDPELENYLASVLGNQPGLFP